MPHWFLFAGALCGATGVVAGAFGAHALKSHLTAASLSTWETAVTYQLTHALALLCVGVLVRIPSAGGPVGNPPPSLSVAGWGFLLGVLLFSGSLYVLALGGPRWLGPVTPLGGVSFVAGWLALAVWAWR